MCVCVCVCGGGGGGGELVVGGLDHQFAQLFSLKKRQVTHKF